MKHQMFGLLEAQRRILTFRVPGQAYRDHPKAALTFGLLITWLAGIGRYWDHPNAYLFQYLGLGSLAYVFVLSAVLFLIAWPLKPANWSYRGVLKFVTFTSAPALLYAIPVERFMSLGAAQAMNVGFLAVVAIWRVALLIWFYRGSARLPWMDIATVTILPLTLIVTALSILNLEHATFQIMAGLRDGPAGTAGDQAYVVVLLLTLASWVLLPLFLIVYCLRIARYQGWLGTPPKR